MTRRNIFPIAIFLLILVACATPTTTPAIPSPTRSVIPTPTALPSATPTLTPVPPLILQVHWPERVSALEPISMTLDLESSGDLDVTASITAAILDPEGNVYQQLRLYSIAPTDDIHYAPEESFQLPLTASAGPWQLILGIQTPYSITGPLQRTFHPTALTFQNLSGTIRTGALISVPQAFKMTAIEGGLRSGKVTWQYQDQQLELWWLPGASEPLTYNQAVMALETTHDPAADPTLLDFTEATWKELRAYQIHERWVAPQRSEAETWIIQGEDHWYYILRLRNLKGTALPTLLKMIGETFTPAPKS